MFLISAIAAFILAVLFILFFLRFGFAAGLVASVGEHRQHERPTPLIGGLAMVCSILIILFGFALTIGGVDTSLIYHYLAGVSLLLVIGVLDDRYHLPFVLRFIVQIVAVLIMVKQGNILYSLGELFSGNTLLLGSFAVPMTVFATVGVINALNMSDGIDGLAASFCLIALGVLLLFPFEETYRLIIVLWIGALIAFLLFNLRFKQPARIFMGDAGSTVLGFTLAWLFIYGSQQAVEVVPIPRHFTPIFAVWVLALPLFDTVSLMCLRLRERKSPFYADRGHMHHHLLDYFKSVNISLIVLLLWFAAYCGLGLALMNFEIAAHKQTILFAICFILHLALQAYLRQKNRT